jgi:hypothetical protein
MVEQTVQSALETNSNLRSTVLWVVTPCCSGGGGDFDVSEEYIDSNFMEEYKTCESNRKIR